MRKRRFGQATDVDHVGALRSIVTRTRDYAIEIEPRRVDDLGKNLGL